MVNSKVKPKLSHTGPEILMLGYLCVKDADTLINKVIILERFGITDEDISIICGSAVQSVRNARQHKKSKIAE
jgi:hypothetical protein